MAPKLAEFGLDWIEEPLMADRPTAEWTQVAAVAPAPLAGGENLRGAGAFQAPSIRACSASCSPMPPNGAAIPAACRSRRPPWRPAAAIARTIWAAAIGLMHSLHLLAAVRGPGLLEVDANPNPLREGLLGEILTVTDGCVSLPGGQGLGLEPDLKPLANLRSLHLERHA